MPIPRHPDMQLSEFYQNETPQTFDFQGRRPAEDCDGPISNIHMAAPSIEQGTGGHVEAHGEALCSNRAELIERIKRGESPTWMPNQALQQEYLKANNRGTSDPIQENSDSREPSTLLHAANHKLSTSLLPSPSIDRSDEELEIQRPRSALHAGDFAAGSRTVDTTGGRLPLGPGHSDSALEDGDLNSSPTMPWYMTPASIGKYGQHTSRFSLQDTANSILERRPWRSRAPSLSSYPTSSYVLKAPTTPLVQQSNNTDLDFSPRDRSLSPDKSSRRRTLPPHAFHDTRVSSDSLSNSQSTRYPPSYRREGSFPYGHHPRRSLTSNWSLQASTSPQTPPFLRSRRTSLSSDASPLQHAHMVGSYEESILRGWMSTAPSKPLDFTAQIGVLGRENCKPKCPAHVTVPFPAVFYSWNSGNGRNALNDDPSPYVGHIDLQHTLTPTKTREVTEKVNISAGHHTENLDLDHDTATKPRSRGPRKRRRDSLSSAPPGGSYRIPQQGQLQIVIKNPNKTAVKLFLVPYDLEDMESGTKTFVRQKSYSVDPVTETSQSSSRFSNPALAAKKPTLRYLIDLKMCSPSKGRFYLYQRIRVVFANRVPDDKEPLRNEVQLPQPKYSAYKPNRDSFPALGSSAGARLTAEKAYRRRSFGFGTGLDEVDGRDAPTFTGGNIFSPDTVAVPPIPAIPFDIAVSRQKSVNKFRDDEDIMEVDSSRPTTSDDLSSPMKERFGRLAGPQLSSSFKSSSSQGSDSYSKLIKGESGYGGVLGRPGTPEPGEGLLARRLRGFGVGQDGVLDEHER